MAGNDTPTMQSAFKIKDHVLYDHKGVVVINKPAGFVSRGIPNAPNSIATCSEELRTHEWPEMHRVVHRLDEDTSGVLLIARTKDVAQKLPSQFQAHAVGKIYWALIDGVPQKDAGLITSPVPFYKREATGYVLQQKAALTQYRVLQKNGDAIAFVCFTPHTGRAHQLRMHAARDLNAPILGDVKYHQGFSAANSGKGMLSTYSGAMFPAAILEKMNGQMLHARSVEFNHPITDERLRIEAPLPSERQAVWKELGFNPGQPG